jgi:hypothetical protein
VVVDAPEVVARADLLAIGPDRRRAALALVERRERTVEREDVETVAWQVELADDLGPQQRNDVAEDREPKAREELLGDRRTAEDMPLLEHDCPHPGPRQVRGADEPVMATADHDRVVALGHAPSVLVCFVGSRECSGSA